jgi:hypothetical protein
METHGFAFLGAVFRSGHQQAEGPSARGEAVLEVKVPTLGPRIEDSHALTTR